MTTANRVKDWCRTRRTCLDAEPNLWGWSSISERSPRAGGGVAPCGQIVCWVDILGPLILPVSRLLLFDSDVVTRPQASHEEPVLGFSFLVMFCRPPRPPPVLAILWKMKFN